MKLTAATITDVQIRELREKLLQESGNRLNDDTDACGMALWPESSPIHAFHRNEARARLAEILNVRAKESS